MEIKFHKSYLKAYKKLPLKIQLQAEKRIKIFIDNRKNPLLNDHNLVGSMKGKRAFSVTGDYRIIYEEHVNGNVVFLFLDVGKHTQVY